LKGPLRHNVLARIQFSVSCYVASRPGGRSKRTWKTYFDARFGNLGTPPFFVSPLDLSACTLVESSSLAIGRCNEKVQFLDMSILYH